MSYHEYYLAGEDLEPDDCLPPWKRPGYAEVMREHADLRRKELKENPPKEQSNDKA